MAVAEPVWTWESYIPGTDEWYQRLGWAGHVIGGPVETITGTVVQVGGGAQEAAQAAVPEVVETIKEGADYAIRTAQKGMALYIVAGGVVLALGLVGAAVAWRVLK
jgi:hypothetical protein